MVIRNDSFTWDFTPKSLPIIPKAYKSPHIHYQSSPKAYKSPPFLTNHPQFHYQSPTFITNHTNHPLLLPITPFLLPITPNLITNHQRVDFSCCLFCLLELNYVICHMVSRLTNLVMSWSQGWPGMQGMALYVSDTICVFGLAVT